MLLVHVVGYYDMEKVSMTLSKHNKGPGGMFLVLRANPNEQIHNKALDLRRRMAKIFLCGAHIYLFKVATFAC